MSEFSFQETMVKVLTDAKIRQSLFAGDSQALRAAGFSDEDLQRLRDISPERLEVFADMVMGQRITDILQILPLTSQILGNRLHALVFEFNQELRPSSSTKQAQALAFAQFLSERFSRQTPQPSYLVDVLRYEMTALGLFGMRNELRNMPDGLIPGLDRIEVQETVVPFRLGANAIIQVEVDILEIATELKDGRIPESPRRQPVLLLMRVDRRGLIEKDQINSTTQVFVEACDNVKTLNEVIEELAVRFQQNTSTLRPDFNQKCVALCQSLIDRLVIGLRLVTDL